MNKECTYFVEIKAPKGLAGIELHLNKCNLPLVPYLSGYNNKVILRSDRDEYWFEWHMDSSDSEIMVASGDLLMPVDEAWRLLNTLSISLTCSGFPHKIYLDDELGDIKHASSFLWEK